MFLFFLIGENKNNTQNLNELFFQILEMIRNFFLIYFSLKFTHLDEIRC